jgi:hypothetical protein
MSSNERLQKIHRKKICLSHQKQLITKELKRDFNCVYNDLISFL